MKSKQLNIMIDEYTSPVGITATRETSVNEIMNMMVEDKVRHIPVTEDGKPVGIISDRDLSLTNSIGNIENLIAEDIMVADPYCVRSGSSIEQVAFDMSSQKIGSALVVDSSGQLEGIFTSVDGLNALIEIVRGDV